MRLDSLTHKEIPADSILKEIGVPKGERQVIMEFLPLIPVALWAGGAAWTAYDTYQAKKAYDRGEITQAQLATRVGTDVAIGIAGGVLGKAVGAGWKVGKRIFKSKKAAKAAQKATADIPTPTNVTAPTGINVVANATTTTAKTSSKKAVQTANPGDTIKTAKGDFIAGVDGKATTTRVSAPNAAEIKKEILKISDTPASSAATVVTTKSVSKTLDKLAGKVDPALQKAADAAKSVATKTIDKTKDAAKSVATKTVDKTVDNVKKIGSKTTSYAGGSSDDIARNYVKNNAKNRMKDLDPIGKKAFVKSIEKSYPGIAKELKLDKLITPTASLTTKGVNKTVQKQLTKTQRNALSNMGTPTASLTTKAANKQVQKQLTKQQRDALSNMGVPAASLTTKAAAKQTTKKLTKTQSDALSGTGKYKAKAPNSKLAPTSSAAVKAASKKVDDVKVKTKKTNTKKPVKKKGKLRGYFSNLNKGNYWDTDLSSVAQKYGYE